MGYTQKELEEMGFKVGKKATAPTPMTAKKSGVPAKTLFGKTIDALGSVGDQIYEGGKGFLKGAASTVAGMSQLGEEALLDPIQRAMGNGENQQAGLGREIKASGAVTPTNAAQKVGFGAERVAEFLIPGNAAVKGAKTAEAGITGARALTGSGILPTAGREILKTGARAGTEAVFQGGQTLLQEGEMNDTVKMAGALGALFPMTGTIFKELTSPLAKPVGGFMKDAGHKILNVVIKPSAPDIKNGFKIENITKYGLGDDLPQMVTKTASTMNGLRDQLESGLASVPKDIRIDPREVLDETIEELQKNQKINFGSNASIQRVVGDLNNEIEKVLKLANDEGKAPDLLNPEMLEDKIGNTVDIVTATDMKRGAGTKGSWVYGSADPDANAIETVYTTYYRKMREKIEQVADEGGFKELKEINKKFSDLIPIQSALIRRLPVEERNSVIGLFDTISIVGAQFNPKLWSLLALHRALRSGKIGAGMVNKGEAVEQGLRPTTTTGQRLFGTPDRLPNQAVMDTTGPGAAGGSGKTFGKGTTSPKAPPPTKPGNGGTPVTPGKERVLDKPVKLYRATTNGRTRVGSFATPQKEFAESFGFISGDKVIDFELPKGARVLEAKNQQTLYSDLFKGKTIDWGDGDAMYKATNKMVKELKDSGYDAVHFKEAIDNDDAMGYGTGKKEEYMLLKKDLHKATPVTAAKPQAGAAGKLYHGSTNASKLKAEGFSMAGKGSGSGYAGVYGEGIYLTSEPGRAKLYGDVVEVAHEEGLKLFKPKDVTTELFNSETNFGEPSKITEYLKSKGYDGVEIGSGKSRELVIFDPQKARVIQSEVAKPSTPPFTGTKSYTTKVLESLRGKTSVSKQFIQDQLKREGIKQAEKDLITKALAGEGDKVDVARFAERVEEAVLPLKRKEVGKDTSARSRGVNDYSPNAMDGTGRYSGVTLGDVRGDVDTYAEHVYESPVKTSAGSVHFDDTVRRRASEAEQQKIADLRRQANNDVKLAREAKSESQREFYNKRIRENRAEIRKLEKQREEQKLDSYFAHTRVEDMADGFTRRVIEAQSDLMQKGNLEREFSDAGKGQVGTGVMSRDQRLEQRNQDVSKLKPYEDTWHERIVREEVKQAAKDGKTQLQFPTGETAMKIEGLGQGDVGGWGVQTAIGHIKLKPEDLKVGKSVSHIGQGDWVITEVTGDGKFKAVPKDKYDSLPDEWSARDKKTGEVYTSGVSKETAEKEYGGHDSIEVFKTTPDFYAEQFDISGSVDKQNPIYRFYESEMAKYLKRKYGAKLVTDEQGVTWWQLDVPKGAAKLPVEAFGIAAGIGLSTPLTAKKDE